MDQFGRKTIKADTVSKCFLESGFVEDDCSDAVKEASENVMLISNICQDISVPFDRDNFVRIDACHVSHYNFEYVTVFQLVRNAENEEQEENEEEIEGTREEKETEIHNTR